MILHFPETYQQDDYTIVSSKVELEEKRTDFPSYLWFRLGVIYRKINPSPLIVLHTPYSFTASTS